MTARLGEELRRIAEGAPVAQVAPDTWSRARRARIRDRALAVAAAAAVVALVGGLVSGWLPRQDAPVAAGAELALPSHIWAVPERMAARNNDGSWMRSQVTADVAVGRAAAAYLMNDGLPVVIGAADGAYHLLDLPGFAGNNRMMVVGLHPAAVALSPDGRQLAYSWATFGTNAATEPIPSGVRVLDLTTGSIREVPLPGREGTAVTALAWSPDSRWLAWAGARMDSWTTWSQGASEPVAGRVAPSATTGEEFAPRRIDTSDAAVAVGVDGEVALFTSNVMTTWDGTTQRLVLNGDVGDVMPGPAPAGSDGRVVLPSYDARRATVADPARRTVRSVDLGPASGTSAVSWRIRPLGWVGDAALLAVDDHSGADAELRLVSVDEPRSRRVGAVDSGVGPMLTVATDLVTTERPTVDRPEPHWPWSDERKAVVIGLAVAGLLLAAWAARRWRRAQRRPAR